jgi:hypothetical protein
MMNEENRQARLERVVGFSSTTAEELAEEVSLWMEEAGEKVILQRDFLLSTGLYACFIVFTE